MPPEPLSLPMWLDPANERLWCGDQALALRPKTFALLRYLVAHPGQLLTKAAVLETLWSETMVSEVVLSVCIRELRQVLGDDARAPRFIETVHRRGYRFIGHLSMVHVSAPRTSSPLLRRCSPGVSANWMRCTALLVLHQPHTVASDWYAYTVMLTQCLLFVGPYGGIYRPKDPARRVPH